MTATHVIRCSPGCVPSPEVFSKIYGVVKRGDTEKYTELFRTVPQDGTMPKSDKSSIVIVLVLFCCVIFSIAIAGTAYYFQEDVYKMFGFDDFPAEEETVA